MTSHVEAQVEARIRRVALEAERKRRERVERAARRRYGVDQRNARKLARLDAVAEEIKGESVG